MKLKRITALLLTFIMAVTAIGFTAGAAEADKTLDYTKMQRGVCDKKDTGTVSVVNDSALGEVVKFAINPAATQQDFITIDGHGADQFGIDIVKYKYMHIEMKFESSKLQEVRPVMRFLSTTDGVNISGLPYIDAENALKADGKWQTITIDMTKLDGKFDKKDSVIMRHVQFSVGGRKYMADSFGAGDAIYVSKIVLSNTSSFTSDATGKGSTTEAGASAVPSAAPSKDDLVIDYTKIQKGVCDNKDTGKVEKVSDSTLGEIVRFTINPAATQQDFITIDGYGLNSLNIDLKKYKYMHVEMKFASSKLQAVTPVVRFISTTAGNVEGMPYIDAKNALSADGKWQTVSFDIGSALSGKIGSDSTAMAVHLQFSVGGRKYMAESFGQGDEIFVSKVVFSNNAGLITEATGSSSTATAPAGPKFDAPDKVLDYSKMQRGICDHKDTGEIKTVEENGDTIVKFTVNAGPQDNDYITIDGYGVESFGVDIAKYKYMLIDMKFDSKTLDEVYPVMRFLSTVSGSVNGAPYLRASNSLPADGQWHKIIINMYDGLISTGVISGDSVIMKHLQFSVGGRELKATNFGNGDVISVNKITLTNDSPNKDKDFKATFKNSFKNGKGENPAEIVGKPGTKFTVPEIPYTAIGYEVIGWMVGSDNKNIIQPGTEMTLGETDMQFEAVWKEVIEAKEFIAIDYAPYFNGVCDHVDTATAEVISLNGKPVIQVIPNPETTSTRGEAINLDGWSYGSAKINLDLYKTLMIEYLYLSDNPVEGNAMFNIMAKNFSGQIKTVAREPIVEGRWAVASFDMTAANDKKIASAEPNIAQAHIYPLGSNSVKNMSANDRIYIGKIIAVPEECTTAIEHESYINGYADGTFGIIGNMTRAEACTIVARLMAAGDANVPTDKTTAFSDVPADQWYHRYISYVESLGFLKSYSGTFAPNQNITRAEFVELVYNMGLLTDAGKNGSFTDVAADHPKATVVAAAGKAGLVNGYANGDGTFSFKPDATITRAEVVKVINNAYGKKPCADGIFDSAKTKFTDVPADHWAFADIIDASVSHISIVDANGNETWKFVDDKIIASDGFMPDYAEGEKVMNEYLALLDKRAEEIKATPNMDLSAVTGKKYYVSESTGNDANDGLTEATALKTISKAIDKAIKGDAVLLKRGDMWRERFKTKGGVIITAYGEGAKPIVNSNLYGDAADESLWTLVEGTENIWKYAKEIPDVGNIVVNGNDTITKLTAGIKIDNGAMYVGSEIFNPVKHIRENKYFANVYSEINGKTAVLDKSTLYVRCDEGNPGKVYSSIELCYKGHGITAVSNTTIDNVALFFSGSHGVGMGTVVNVKFTNMEIGWIGGVAQNTNNGSITRYGNGIEVYGGCDNYVIDNCYVYQCYDAGITHQKQLGAADSCTEQNVYFTNNVIDKCIYNIEYFMGIADKAGVTRLMKNINYVGNLLARSGYGWGYSPSRAASIKGWDHHNNQADGFIVKDNVFLLDRVNAFDAGCGNVAWIPTFEGNTYIQKYGNTLTKIGANGAAQYMMDGTAKHCLENIIGETSPKVYYVKADTVVE